MKSKKPIKSLPSTISLTSLLKKTGHLFPTTEEEVQEFEELFGNTEIILSKEVDDSKFIIEKLRDKKENAKVLSLKENAKKPKNGESDYFKKIVLAAEIANQLCAESTFGRIKFVKVLYLCERVCQMKLSTNYGKYAAGPFDPKLIFSVEAEFKNRKWFIVSERKGGFGYKYSPDENIEQYQQYYPRYFGSQINLINQIIELFRTQKSDFCEIAATMYFVWEKAIADKCTIDDSLLINHFYEWGKEKERFNREQLLNTLSWMKDNQIVPINA